jgi:hypothetical protein
VVVTVLDVRPVGYAEAARTIGGEVAGTVAVACEEVTSRLDACYGMAGSDDIGVEWGAAYDRVAASAIQSTAAVVDAAYTVAALLEQTGINYAGAEAASVPGESAEQSQARWASSSAPSVRDLSSAVGGGVPEPAGWSLLQHAIGRLWPNGHQDLLRGAADTWRAVGSWFRSITVDVDRAVIEVMLQRAPEVSDAAAVIDGLRGQLTELAQVYDDLADACSDYAHHLDEAHHRILEEIHSFIEWTLAIEAAGGLLAAVTLGASEVVAQGAELERAKVTGSAIATVIDALRAAVVALGVTLRGVEARVAVVAEQARVVMIRRVEAAGVVRPGVAGVEAARTVGPADTALVRLEEYAAADRLAEVGPASETWADLTTLNDHYLRHGKDFGCTSEEEYAADAVSFLQRARREGLPTKVDKYGVTRAYDPETNTFGSYAPDGKTFTFFKPKTKTYWDRQKGEPR